MISVISEMMRLEPFDTMESITERALKRASQTGLAYRFTFENKLFEASPAPDGYGTVTLLMERVEEGQLGGNYNDFPWIDKGPSSWASRRDRALMQQDKEAEYLKVEAAKAQMRAEQQAIVALQVKEMTLKPRSLGVTSLSEIAQWTSANQQAMENLTAASPIFSAIESTAVGSNAAMYPGQVFWSDEQEVLRLRGLLRTVENVLGRHLREQLSPAPSRGSVYASGPGYAVTAFEIKQVVQALDAVNAMPMPRPFWSMGIDPGSADFTAESEDGEKIVLSKDGDRFDSGVLFDPSNRPIRKFKLKEMAA